MAQFLVEIPLRVTRENTAPVDRSIKFEVEAEDEDDAVEFMGLLLVNELDDAELTDIEPVLS